jgi:hypothetical protein
MNQRGSNDGYLAIKTFSATLNVAENVIPS